MHPTPVERPAGARAPRDRLAGVVLGALAGLNAGTLAVGLLEPRAAWLAAVVGLPLAAGLLGGGRAVAALLAAAALSGLAHDAFAWEDTPGLGGIDDLRPLGVTALVLTWSLPPALAGAGLRYLADRSREPAAGA